MAELTLEQLKEENAAAAEIETELSPETEEVEVEAAAEETEVEVDEAGEPVETEATGETVEPWMQTEAEDSDDEPKKQASFGGLRNKMKKKVGALKDENDELRDRIANLERGTTAAQQPQGIPPRPTREQHDFNDDAYDVAVDAWNDAKLDLKLSARDQNRQQATSQTQAQTAIATAVDQHLDNADKLIAAGKITEEAYTAADSAVRLVIDQALPQTRNAGESIGDVLISRLNGAGDGSEKVWYHLGRNTSAKDKLGSLLASDPTGLSASIYLGQLQNKLTSSPAKRVSQAPKPGSNLKGDAPVSQSSALKKYKKAGDDPQKRFDIKYAAKQAGEDVSNWSR